MSRLPYLLPRVCGATRLGVAETGVSPSLQGHFHARSTTSNFVGEECARAYSNVSQLLFSSCVWPPQTIPPLPSRR